MGEGRGERERIRYMCVAAAIGAAFFVLFANGSVLSYYCTETASGWVLSAAWISS
jgi:hypothetical protein